MGADSWASWVESLVGRVGKWMSVVGFFGDLGWLRDLEG